MFKNNNKTILLTGTAGFIGSNFVPYFLQKYSNYNLVNIDLLTYAGNLENLKECEDNPRYKFIKGDICNRELVEFIFNEYDIQGVIHFAAESHVDNSIKNPGVFVETNVNGTFTLLDVAYKYWMERPFKYKERFSGCAASAALGEAGKGEAKATHPESLGGTAKVTHPESLGGTASAVPDEEERALEQEGAAQRGECHGLAFLKAAHPDLPRFHHISTDEVYGTLSDDPKDLFTEETPYAPNSPYSASKASSDMIVRSYVETYGMNCVITNCSNNYGPKQHDEKLIPTIIRKALSCEPIPIYGDGKNIRDWLYVLDHCKGIDLAYHKGKAGEVYNIGGRNERTNLQIVDRICSILDDRMSLSKGCAALAEPTEGEAKATHPEDSKGCAALAAPSEVSKGEAEATRPKQGDIKATYLKSYKDLITFVEDRAGHDRRYAIDATKLENELGWRADENFDSGIIKTIDWYLEKYN